MAETLNFQRPARRPMGLAMLAVAVVVLLGLIFVVEAHWVIVALFAAIAAPAFWEAIRNQRASLTLDDTVLSWTSGARSGAVELSDIDEVVLTTTLDFSQRARVQLVRGGRVRIPPECLPGGRDLDVALTERGIRNRRSMFWG